MNQLRPNSPLKKPRTAQETFLTTFLSGISSVRYLILRNYSGLPAEIGNDLDVLVDERLAATVEHTLRLSARSTGYSVINRAEFSPTSLFFAHDQTRKQLHVDLFTGLKWRGFDILRPEIVMAARQDRGLYFVPHPVHEATLNLLTRLLYHGYVKDKYKPEILAAFQTDPEMARQVLAEPFGDDAAVEILTNVFDEDWADLEAATNRWRRLLILRRLARHPLRTLSAIFSDTGRLVRRFAVPPGLMLVLLGPDGSGKSSVAAGVMKTLEPTFGIEKSAHLHWKPSLLRRGQVDAGPTTEPHGKPPRGYLTSLAYFAFHWLEFVVGGHLRIRPALFRNGMVAVDRYYYDFFVDPKRYRLNVPGRLLKWAQRFVMNPDLIVCLDAPTEVLQSRKREVPPDETARQREAYLDLMRELPNAHVVDASRPLNDVVSEVVAISLEYLAERTSRRLGHGTS